MQPIAILDTGGGKVSLLMLHPKIENEEIIERYVRNRLTDDERRAFEEHFFACDECFEKLQATERFFAGVRDAAGRGLLKDQARASAASSGKLFAWAFAACASIAVTLAGVVGWMSLIQIPRLRGELVETSAQLHDQQQNLAQLEQRISSGDSAEANVPLVMLQASRGEESAITVLQPGSKRLVIWVEIGPTRYRNFRMEVFSKQEHLVSSVDRLQPGPYGELSASLPTEQLPNGEFRIKLTGQDPPPPFLVGEYKLMIRRR